MGYYNSERHEHSEDGVRHIERVYGLADFSGLHTEDEWTEEEMAPIVAILTEVNQDAIDRWGPIRNTNGKLGLGVGWNFVKLPPTRYPNQYWSWLWTWERGDWGDATVTELAEKLRRYYSRWEDKA